MRKKIIIGNWKMNKTSTEAIDFFKKVKKLLKINRENVMDCDYGVAVPATLLSLAVNKKKDSKMIICAQNMNDHENGAYTGEIAPNMVVDTNATAVVIGHSERRQYYNETDETVNQKTKLAISHGLLPVVCIGETLEEFEAGRTEEIIKSQISSSLKDIDYSKIVVAYEPIWAIGTGKTATPEQAQNMCKLIRELTDVNLRIQYGGSVKPDNIADLMSQPDIDGALVGGASLDPEGFVKLLTLNR